MCNFATIPAILWSQALAGRHIESVFAFPYLEIRQNFKLEG